MAVWTQRIVGSAAGMVADAAELRRALALFADPAHACEIMILGVGPDRKKGWGKARPGTDLDGLAREAREFPSGAGIYFRVNPVPLGFHKSASDRDVVRRRWLFVDVDPVKADGFADYSATDAEKLPTGLVADDVVGYLSGLGWPAPVVTDSGNGYGLFWRCDLPNDPLTRDTVQALLQDLARRFDGAAEIDTKVFNAARLAKLPGTWARKGVELPDRPHRACRLVSVPERLELVGWELLKTAVPAPKPAPEPTPEAPTPRPRPTEANGRAGTCYGLVALRNVIGEVAAAPVGNRNDTLYRKAARLGELAAAGEVDRGEAEALLKEAGAAADPGRADTAATVDRGMKKGAENPKTAPARRGEPRVVFGKTAFGKAVGAGAKKLTVSLAEVEPLEVDWLVPGRVAKRFITVFAGRTGVGKSFVASDLIARLTTGGEIPGGGGECFKPGGALVVSEDSHEYVLAPRLIALGADLRRVHAMTWEAMGHYFLGDTDMLGAACDEVAGGVSMVLIDPPTNFLDDVDEHKNAEVRQLVMRVVEWCFARDLACVFVLHVNKQAGGSVDAINRVMGSVAWVTTVRIAHTFCVDPDDPTRCLWMPMKNNLGEKGKGLAYRIGGQPARVEWLGEVEMTADEAMAAEPKARRRAVVAADWLVEKFRERREWPSDDLFAAARAENVSKNAIYAAKDLLNIPRARKETLEGGDARWIWWVPEDWSQLSRPREENGTVGTVGVKS